MAKITDSRGVGSENPFARLWPGYSIVKPVRQPSRKDPYSREVIGFEKHFSDHPLEIPYTLAILSCGHRDMVLLRPRRGRCNRCSDQNEVDLPDEIVLPPDMPTTCQSCRGWDFKISYQPDPHNEMDFITKAGQLVACGACLGEAKDLEWLQSLDPSKIFPARFDPENYYLFRRNPASPSGFTAIGRIAATAEIEAVIRRLPHSAILPMDAAYQPLAIEIGRYGGFRRKVERK